ncbi:unnamed protein product [Larinioides sclopetarius]|uniref:DUF5641 domain-containing protein n=1 Tax=Larinioides sclopetarius TaxID=280406 RepID=A0AAV2BJ71_9ARAC
MTQFIPGIAGVTKWKSGTFDPLYNIDSEKIKICLSGHSREVSLSIGDLFLLETDEKRINWPLGDVIEVFSEADGQSRVAKKRTADGENFRRLQGLYILEIERFENLSFVSQQRDQNSKPPSPVSPNDADQDSSGDDSATRVVPDVVTRVRRCIKIR